jgi:hypothetical protein
METIPRKFSQSSTFDSQASRQWEIPNKIPRKIADQKKIPRKES